MPSDVPITDQLDRIAELMTKVEGLGSVELKVTLADEQRLALADLGLDPLNAVIRQVFFVDTPELALFQAGVVPRARRTQNTDDDTVVKLRPVVAADLAPEFHDSPNMKLELDITRDSEVISASMKGKRTAGTLKDTVRGKLPIGKLFTKEQRAFFSAIAPSEIGWDDLVFLGPITVIKLKTPVEGLSTKLTVEVWFYPGEDPLIELSTTTPTESLAKTAVEAIAFVRGRGLHAIGQQEPKTRKALEYLVGHRVTKA